MKKISNYNRFINESKVEETIEQIEDCLLEFCDKYGLKISVRTGYNIQYARDTFGSYLHPSLYSEVVEQLKEKGAKVTKCYEVQMMSAWAGPDSGIIGIDGTFDENMDNYLHRAMKRIERVTKLQVDQSIELQPSFWSIIFCCKERN